MNKILKSKLFFNLSNFMVAHFSVCTFMLLLSCYYQQFGQTVLK